MADVARQLKDLQAKHEMQAAAQTELQEVLQQHALSLQALQQQVHTLLKATIPAASAGSSPVALAVATDCTWDASAEPQEVVCSPLGAQVADRRPPHSHVKSLETVRTEEALGSIIGSPLGVKNGRHPPHDHRVSVNTLGTEDKVRLGGDIGVERRRSCWDAAAFVGHSNVMTTSESVALVVMVFLTVLMQCAFLAVIFNSLTGAEITEEAIQSFKLWRLSSAHRHDLVDDVQMESLASRVCREDASLHLSQKQAEMVSLINSYLYDSKPFNGPLMCTLALVSWVLVVLHEIQVILERFRTLAHLPRGTTTFIYEKEEIRLTSLHRNRVVWSYFLLILRSVIVILLLLAGLDYLAFTIELPELILNAIALEFILKIDEMVFLALAPFRTRSFCKVLKTAVPSRRYEWDGMDIQGIFCVIMLLVAVSYAMYVKLVSHIDLMVRAHDALCGGQLDWAYGMTKAGFLVWAQLESRPSTFETTEQYNTLHSLTSASSFTSLSQDVMHFRMIGYQGGSWSVSSVTEWPLATFGLRLNNGCEDQLTETGIATNDRTYHLHLASLRDAAGNHSIRLCSDVASYCEHGVNVGVFTRLACPVTCGCRNPASDLVMAAEAGGCGVRCLAHPEYRAEIEEAPCREGSMEDAVERERWSRFAARAKTAFSYWPDSTGMLTDMAEGMESLGCAIIPLVLERHRWNLCIEGGSLRSLALRCPRTCGCYGGGPLLALTADCPGTCANRTNGV